MAWTVIEANSADIADSIQSFEDEAGTSSIDDISVTSIGRNRIVAVIKYTAA